MNCKVFFLLLATTFASAFATAQDLQKHHVYAEAFGSGLWYCVNYERITTKHFTFRIGFSGIGYEALPVSIGKLFGKSKHHLDASLGLTPVTYWIDYPERGQQFEILATAFIGYRYQSLQRRMVFRVGAAPLYTIMKTVNGPGEWFPSGAVSLGYAFH